MATWHQSKNRDGLCALWTPHETSWKVIDDKPGAFASSILFQSEFEAIRYQAIRGGVILAPRTRRDVRDCEARS